MDDRTDTVFVGATRPAMAWGVTYEWLLLEIVVIMLLFIMTSSFWWFLFAPISHGIGYVLCGRDPRAVRLFWLRGQTYLRSLTRLYWKTSTTTPLENTRGKSKRKLKDSL